MYWRCRVRTTSRGCADGRPPEAQGLSRAELADQLDLRLAGVGVGALVVEQRQAVGFGLGGRPGVGRRQPGLDALRDQALGLVDQGVDHLVLGHDPDDLAPDEQVAATAAGGDAEVGDRASPGPLTTQPMTATWIGRLRSARAASASVATLDDVDLGPAAGRAGDEVDALRSRSPSASRSCRPACLLDRVGGEAVADGVADALEQQGARCRRWP